MGVFLFFVFASATIFFESARAVIAPPSIITYQGKLLENDLPVTTAKSMSFLIYDALTAGNLLYTASGTLAVTTTVSITPSSGIFSVDLGDTSGTPSTNAVTSSIFANDSSVYLEVWIGGVQMTPRKRLTSVPYAVNAQYLMGIAADSSSTSQHIAISNSTGGFTFAGDPQGTGIGDGSVYINPAAADANETLFGIAVGGNERFRVDQDGDVFVTGTLSVTGTVQFQSTSTFNGVMNGLGNITNIKEKGVLVSGTMAPYGLAVQGDYAYVGSWDALKHSLEIIDISDPSNPAHVSSLEEGVGSSFDVVHDIEVSGNYAYLSVGNSATSGLQIVDISNPKTPVAVALLKDGTDGAKLGYAQGIAIQGSYAYIAASNDSALEIVDISDPINPKHVAFVADGDPVKLGLVSDVAVSGNYAYLVSNSDNALEIIDITVPSKPFHVASLVDGAGGARLDTPTSIFVQGKYAYITASGSDDALEIVDISNPYLPTHIGFFADGDGGALLDTPKDVVVSGDYAYVATVGDNSVEIIDVSDPSDPTRVDGVANGGIFSLQSPEKIQVLGNYVYITALASNALQVLDVSGAKIAHTEIGTAKVGQLQVEAKADFLDGVHVRNGLQVGNGLFLGGDFAMYSNSSTVSATNTLYFSDRVLFKTNASSTQNNLFIFDTYNSFTTTASTTYLLSVRNQGQSAFSVASNGDVAASGTLFASNAAIGTPGTPGDLAERVDIAPEETVEPGDVMMVDPTGIDRYKKSTGVYQQAIAGVISTNPTITVGNGRTEHTAIMALVGRVPIKVSTENGNIEQGDLLVASSISGHAMKYDSEADDETRVVGIIGVALESFDGETGKILGLVRSGWMNNRHQTIAGMQQNLQELAAAAGIPLQQNPQVLHVREQQNGQIGIVQEDLNLQGYYITNVAGLRGKDDVWNIDEQGRFITHVQTSEGNTALYALQSKQTEYIFSGTSTLVFGEASILFDQVTQDIIDPAAAIKVSITLTAEANGVYVSQKSATGFTVKELSGGTSTATFDWVVIAQRKSDSDDVPLAPPAEEDPPIEAEPDPELIIPDGGGGEEELPPEEVVIIENNPNPAPEEVPDVNAPEPVVPENENQPAPDEIEVVVQPPPEEPPAEGNSE